MTRPVVELRCGPTPAVGLRQLVRDLGRRWCRVEARPEAPAARLASTWDLAQLRRLLRDDLPVAVWFDDPGDLTPIEDDLPRAAALVGPAPVAQAVPGALAAPAEALDCTVWRHASPSVRRRRRLVHRAPEDLVLDVASLPGDVSSEQVAILLGLAAAAIVRGRWALPALAMGTPLVTDARTAEWLGAVDEGELVVGDGSSGDLAAALAADDTRAARLGWGGRLLVERRFDSAGLADLVAAALGLPGAAPGVGRAREVLAELHTPVGSIPGQRVAALLTAFPAATSEGVRSWTW